MEVILSRTQWDEQEDINGTAKGDNYPTRKEHKILPNGPVNDHDIKIEPQYLDY